MRHLIIAILLSFACAMAHAADSGSPALVVLPDVDFPYMKPFDAAAKGAAALDDGRQIIVLGNGMAFVSIDDARLPALPKGAKIHIGPLFGKKDGRQVYALQLATGNGQEVHMNGIRFR